MSFQRIPARKLGSINFKIPHCAREAVRKQREQLQLFGFVTCDANAEVGAVHAKATPVILTTEAEIETWTTAPPEEALQLQRPLPDGSLRIVATGEKEGGEAA